MTVTKEEYPCLTRAQNRLLRRIYNGRAVPIVADGIPFLTYKAASRYLRSLGCQARDAAYAAMKEQAKVPVSPPKDRGAAKGSGQADQEAGARTRLDVDDAHDARLCTSFDR